MELTEKQIERYSRHILLKDVGGEGQAKLLSAKVLLIGAGGLGAPIALYLAAAGIGTIGIADGDKVELSNLQRQVIHFTRDIDTPKVDSAGSKMTDLNPDVKVVPYREHIFAHNIRDIIADKDFDFIIDGTDNFAAKFLINDACVLLKKPFSHGGVLRFTGQTMTYIPDSTCYRCVFITPPPQNMDPTCSQAGILGAIAGILGTIQAAEALKYILGCGDLLINRMLTFDALKMNFRTIPLNRNPECPLCGENPTITELQDHRQPTCDLKEWIQNQ